MSKDLDNRIKVYLKKKTGVDVRDEDIDEIRNSLRHLGRAICLYEKEKVKDSSD